MAYEQYSVPLAGDILDDLATAFREIFSKVCSTWILHNESLLFKTQRILSGWCVVKIVA